MKDIALKFAVAGDHIFAFVLAFAIVLALAVAFAFLSVIPLRGICF